MRRAVVAAMLLCGIVVGCGRSREGEVVGVADAPAGGPPVQESVVIVGDELQFLEGGAVRSARELPAVLEPAMAGFGLVVAAVTADHRHLAYLGWDPAPALARVEGGEVVEEGTPLGVQVLHLVDLSSGEHLEIQGVESFALRSNGDVAYAQTPNPSVMSQVRQDTRLVHRSVNGDEVIVSEGGYATAATWSQDRLLYTTAESAEPGPFVLMAYVAETGASMRVGDDLSPFAALEDGRVLLLPNFDSFPGNFKSYDVQSGHVSDLAFEGPEDVAREIRVIGLGLVEDGAIVFHGQREPSAIEVVGRLTLAEDAISLAEMATLDTRSLAGIQQISSSRDGAITGWGLNPRTMPSQERGADPAASRVIEFTCTESCEYHETGSRPVVQVAVIPAGQR